MNQFASDPFVSSHDPFPTRLKFPLSTAAQPLPPAPTDAPAAGDLAHSPLRCRFQHLPPRPGCPTQQDAPPPPPFRTTVRQLKSPTLISALGGPIWSLVAGPSPETPYSGGWTARDSRRGRQIRLWYKRRGKRQDRHLTCLYISVMTPYLIRVTPKSSL